MGQEITTSRFKESDFSHFKELLRQETELLAYWFESNCFSKRTLVAGYELEAWLVDNDFLPSSSNEQFLQQADSALLTQELAQFNIEINAEPLQLKKNVLSAFEEAFNKHWHFCQAIAEQIGCRLLSTGILPTLDASHLTLKNISNQERYHALNEQVLRQRGGEAFKLNINGRESIKSVHRDVMLEAASTSLQIHLQVTPEMAVRYYNASIILSAPLVAISANSPFYSVRTCGPRLAFPFLSSQ